MANGIFGGPVLVSDRWQTYHQVALNHLSWVRQTIFVCKGLLHVQQNGRKQEKRRIVQHSAITHNTTRQHIVATGRVYTPRVASKQAMIVVVYPAFVSLRTKNAVPNKAPKGSGVKMGSKKADSKFAVASFVLLGKKNVLKSFFFIIIRRGATTIRVILMSVAGWHGLGCSKNVLHPPPQNDTLSIEHGAIYFY